MSKKQEKETKLNKGLKKGIEDGLENKKEQPAVSPEFAELIGKALIDQEFRKQLFTDQKSVLKKYKLNKDDLVALDKITEETLKKHIEGIGGTAAWKIYVEISKSF